MARIVRFVLAKMKSGVTAEEYETFEREVDYAIASRLTTIVSYRTHRITDVGPRLQGGPWDYLERIEITDRKAYEQELANDPDGKRLLDELYSKYLIRESTTSIWTEMIE